MFDRVKRLFSPGPEEQVLGYSPLELQRLFPHPMVAGREELPGRTSLESRGIHAIYAAFLIDKGDLENFMACVDGSFRRESTRRFQGERVLQNASIDGVGRLCFLIEGAFGGHIVKCLTDSLDFLADIDCCAFAPPPPWVAFEGYNPDWWGGAMQGEQGYYNHHFFQPFFLGLNVRRRRAYCAKSGASPEWRRALALFYDVDA